MNRGFKSTRTPGGTGGRIKTREVGDLYSKQTTQTTPASGFLRVKITRDSKPTTPESSFRTKSTRSPLSPSSAPLSKGRTSLEPVSEEGNSACHEWSGLSGFPARSRSASPGSETHTNNGHYLSPASLQPLAAALEAALDAADADRVMEMARVQMEVALHREVDRAKRLELASLRQFAQRKIFAAKEEAARHVEATYKRILTEQRAIREELEAELARVRAIATNVAEAQAAAEKARLEAQEARDEKLAMEQVASALAARAREVLSSHQEGLNAVRQYSDSLETALQQVEDEKMAMVQGAAAVTATEVAAVGMLASRKIAEQRMASLQAILKAEEQTRAAHLEAELLRCEVAKAASFAADAEAARFESLALLEASKSKEAVLQITSDAERRVERAQKDFELRRADFQMRLDAERRLSAYELREAEAQVRAALAEGSAATAAAAVKEAETKSSVLAERATAERERREVERAKWEVTSRIEAVTTAARNNREAAAARAAATLERTNTEAWARATAAAAQSEARVEHARAEAKTLLDAERALAQIGMAASEAKHELLRQAAEAEASAKLAARLAEADASQKAARAGAEARHEWSTTILRAARNEAAAAIKVAEVFESTLQATGNAKLGAEKKISETRGIYKQARDDAEALKNDATVKLRLLTERIRRALKTDESEVAIIGAKAQEIAKQLAASQVALETKRAAEVREVEQARDAALLHGAGALRMRTEAADAVCNALCEQALAKWHAANAVVEEMESAAVATMALASAPSGAAEADGGAAVASEIVTMAAHAAEAASAAKAKAAAALVTALEEVGTAQAARDRASKDRQTEQTAIKASLDAAAKKAEADREEITRSLQAEATDADYVRSQQGRRLEEQRRMASYAAREKRQLMEAAVNSCGECIAGAGASRRCCA